MIVSKNKAFVPIVPLVCAINLQATDNINWLCMKNVLFVRY